MKHLLPTLLVAAALSACASTPTLYQPAAGPQAVGFSEFRIEPGRYRIRFQGGPGAPVAQVNDYALLRASELALAEGYDWFRVTDRQIEGAPGSRSRMSVGLGGGSGGWHSGVGVGLGTSFDLGGGPAVTASIEVLMGRGPRPANEDVYDARGVSRSIGSHI